MADQLVSGLIEQGSVRVLVAVTSDLSRHARAVHRLADVSAALLAQALTAVALQGGLLKDQARVSLQLECDGPLRGLFADYDGDGGLRGYVKNREVVLRGDAPEFRWRPALGNSGFLSSLRQRDSGDFYRSSVALEKFELAQDLERFFATSEQVPTRIALEVLDRAGDPLGQVVGVLAQVMPGGEPLALDALFARLSERGGVSAAFAEGVDASPAATVERVLGQPLEVLSHRALRYQCRCARERVQSALASLGSAELEAMIAEQGKAEVTCEFCSTRYDFTAEQLRELARPAGSSA